MGCQYHLFWGPTTVIRRVWCFSKIVKALNKNTPEIHEGMIKPEKCPPWKKALTTSTQTMDFLGFQKKKDIEENNPPWKFNIDDPLFFEGWGSFINLGNLL